MSAEIAVMEVEEHPQAVQVDGATAAAILLMLLPDEEAGEILKSLDPSTVRQLSEGMFKVAIADEETVEAALDLFVNQCRSISSLAVGAKPHIRSVLTRAVGNIRADNILTEIAPSSSAAALELLRWMDVEIIAQVLKREHAQVAALVLAVLTPEISAKALQSFDERTQADLLARAARLTKVRREAIEDLEAILAEYNGGAQASSPFKVGGTSDAAKIVSRMRRADSQRVINSLKETDEALAAAIEREMFVFDDLGALDDKSLGAVLRSVEGPILTLALRGTGAELLEQMLGCMSSRAAETIRDELADSPPAKRSEVEEAQRTILAAARKLADAGEIQIGAGEDEYV